MSSKVSNIFSDLGSKNVNIAMIAGLVVLFLAIAANFIAANIISNRNQALIADAAELRVLSQALAKSAVEAANGNEEAFSLLKEGRSEFDERWSSVVDSGAADKGLVSSVNVEWKGVREQVDTILEAESVVLELHNGAATLGEIIPMLQMQYEEVVEVMLEANAPADQVAVAQRQSWLAERVVRSVQKVLEGGDGAEIAAESFSRDANLFGRMLRAQLKGDSGMGVQRVRQSSAVDSLTGISEMFEEYINPSIEGILESSPELFSVMEASQTIFFTSEDLLLEATKLVESIEGGSFVPSTALGGVLAVIFLGLFGFFAFINYQQASARRQEIERENEKNQTAILRLLDELGDLADGDLTVHATVTEDFTGAIADSINFSIDQLRELVSTINQTALSVNGAAQETQSTAVHLAEASEHQAQEIAGASAAVNEMAVSIDQVSANATESSAVAQRSLGIANKGAEVVQNTIAGMDTIREQIQETSKRIKRLGESSQEIGDIISLINDIADQTNILSLNAAIQASMAGDAGRGFAVVADEVQRLAERSSSATKQIETLVKTIQADTNEAVISMEQTTSEVVKGANLAQNAGVALEEIESVSSSLAELIQNISNAARQQAASAGHISNTMNVIQEITSQTSSGTTATADSIGNLTAMAANMQESVAGFTLPDEVRNKNEFEVAAL